MFNDETVFNIAVRLGDERVRYMLVRYSDNTTFFSVYYKNSNDPATFEEWDKVKRDEDKDLLGDFKRYVEENTKVEMVKGVPSELNQFRHSLFDLWVDYEQEFQDGSRGGKHLSYEEGEEKSLIVSERAGYLWLLVMLLHEDISRGKSLYVRSHKGGAVSINIFDGKKLVALLIVSTGSCCTTLTILIHSDVCEAIVVEWLRCAFHFLLLWKFILDS